MKDLPTHLMKISDLKPAEYNPRQLTEKQFDDIKASIESLGYIDPIIVNQHPERKNVIVGGHQRVKVLQSMGYTEVPCIHVNFDLQKEREANIRHNKNTGDWDFDVLANEFEMDDLKDWGFVDSDFGDFGGTLGDDDDDDEPSAPSVQLVTCPKCGEVFDAKQNKA